MRTYLKYRVVRHFTNVVQISDKLWIGISEDNGAMLKIVGQLRNYHSFHDCRGVTWRVITYGNAVEYFSI